MHQQSARSALPFQSLGNGVDFLLKALNVSVSIGNQIINRPIGSVARISFGHEIVAPLRRLANPLLQDGNRNFHAFKAIACPPPGTTLTKSAPSNVLRRPDTSTAVTTQPWYIEANQEYLPLQFAVGLKLKSKSEHVIVDAEDALIAALKVKAERPEALIMYVRRQNRRGDTRNPPGRRGS